MKTLVVVLSMLSIQAFAKTTEVIYFGGYKASKAQMECWVKGAKANTAKNKGYNYRAIAWPAGAPAGPPSSIVSTARSTMNKLIQEINANSDTRYIVLGHSSGAALSNQLGREVKNPKQVDLINLDGFSPDASLQRRVKTSACWSAVRKNSVGQTLASSRNAGSMSRCSNHKVFANFTCTPGSSMCLHFSLVNTKAPSNLGGDFVSRGYNSCSTNLDVIP